MELNTMKLTQALLRQAEKLNKEAPTELGRDNEFICKMTASIIITAIVSALVEVQGT